ncbi:MAG: ABC transporter permease [Candidatus Krumholzibacteriia bacterium]
MRKLRAIALKELRQVRRDPLSLTMLLGLPAFMLILYGYAISFDVEHVPLAVQDRSPGAAGRAVIDALVTSRQFDLAAVLPADADLAQVFTRRRARAVLVVPESFGRDRAAGREARVQLLVDGTDANTAAALLANLNATLEQLNATARAAAPGLTDGGGAGIAFAPRVWYNPELRSSHFLVPGLIGFIMMLTAVLSTALSVVREKERGTMEQLRVAPLHPAQLIIGKTLPYLGISLLATAIILAAARLLFGVVVRGSYFDLLVATLVYLFGALGWGLLVSTLADSQAAAFQIGIITSMLPATFLSGFIFPIRNMPPALEFVSHVVPARYYLVVLRGIILKGAGLGPYWRQMAGLGVYAVVVAGLASARLFRREA